MERKARDLIQRIDDKLDHHPRGYVGRNYNIYDDAFSNSRGSSPPYIWLIIQNPRGRAKPTKKDKEAEFYIELDLYKAPHIPHSVASLDVRLKELGFEISEPDEKGLHTRFQPGDIKQGSTKGKLTLENYDDVFDAIICGYDTALSHHSYLRPYGQNPIDNRSWILKQMRTKLSWLYDIFKDVYSDLDPLPAEEPVQRKKFKQRKLF